MVCFTLTSEFSKVNELVHLMEYNNSVKIMCQKLTVLIWVCYHLCDG